MFVLSLLLLILLTTIPYFCCMNFTQIWQLVFYSFCLVTLIQLFYYLFFFIRLAVYKTKPKATSQTHPVSVIICARDEAANLAKNLPGALVQQYRTTHEIIVVDDNSFDVVFCKEAFHHFPRPYLALYEMLRVSKKAVVMIEPSERLITNGVKSKPYILSAIQLLFSKLIGRTFTPYVPEVLNLSHSFEVSGNYLYAVSIREMEKLVHGMDLGGLAWKGLNDVYEKGCEFEEAKEGNPLFDSISKAIAKGDELCKTYPQFHQHNMVCVMLFKEKPDEALASALQQAGFQLPTIHKNPYV